MLPAMQHNIIDSQFEGYHFLMDIQIKCRRVNTVL